MNIVQVCGFGLLGVITVLVLRSFRPEYATVAGIAVGLLELPGVHIELEAALLHGGENGGTGLLADIGMVIKDTGNGADGVAGLRCEVFDGHKRHLPGENSTNAPLWQCQKRRCSLRVLARGP